MLDPKQLKADILEDMRVDLSDEFDRNFGRGFSLLRYSDHASAMNSAAFLLP